jgi:hypothetical protein
MAICLLSCNGLLVRIHSCFACLGIMVVYNWLNTCLYILWSTLNFDLMHSIAFLSQNVFDKFIAKGGENVHKVGWTLANRVVERRNMIMSNGRACMEMVRGGLILSFSLLFLWFCRFSCHLLVLRFFLLLDDPLELFFGFWSSNCASWGLRFKIQTLCILLSMYSSRGRLINQVVSTLFRLWWVIDLSWLEFKSGIFWLFYPIICSCGESCLLVSWCVGNRCDMVGSCNTWFSEKNESLPS